MILQFNFLRAEIPIQCTSLPYFRGWISLARGCTTFLSPSLSSWGKERKETFPSQFLLISPSGIHSHVFFIIWQATIKLCAINGYYHLGDSMDPMNVLTYFKMIIFRVTTERRRRSAKSTGNWTSRGGECGARWSTRADKMAQVKMDNFACLNYLFCGCFIFWPSVKLRHLWLSNFSASETGTLPVQ